MYKKLGHICILMMLVLPLIATLATAEDCGIENTKTDSVEGNIETLFRDGNKTYVFIDIDYSNRDKGIGYVFLDVSVTDYATLIESEEDNTWLTIFYEESCDGCRILAIHIDDSIIDDSIGDWVTMYCMFATGCIVGMVISFVLAM